jgi:hypothetical protein
VVNPGHLFYCLVFSVIFRDSYDTWPPTWAGPWEGDHCGGQGRRPFLLVPSCPMDPSGPQSTNSRAKGKNREEDRSTGSEPILGPSLGAGGQWGRASFPVATVMLYS